MTHRDLLCRRTVFAAVMLILLAPARLPGQSSPRRMPGRLVGVFDLETGAPIEGVEVMDIATKVSALTTATGTLTLFFVDTSGSLIRLRKVGYRPELLFVNNSPRDSVPLTLTMTRAVPELPAVVTRARGRRGPADTLRRLELNGFYDRRYTSSAPAHAFVTGEELEKFTRVSDVGFRGRGICEKNVYIDGIRVFPPTPTRIRGQTIRGSPGDGRSFIDLMLSPTEVSAIETYTATEAPVEYMPSRTAVPLECLTLIWTR
jgi:hypothetical protein